MESSVILQLEASFLLQPRLERYLKEEPAAASTSLQRIASDCRRSQGGQKVR